MVDSRQKGARAESALVNLLKTETGFNWKRTPGSGALHQDHGLKGDAYIPNEKNYYAVEVKHYKDTQLDYKILTSKDPMLLQWWEQAVRQGNQTDKKPMLFFKHDRSKWFVAMDINDDCLPPLDETLKSMIIYPEGLIVFTFDIWVENVLSCIQWIK